MNEVADVEFPTQENVQSDLRSLFQGAVRTGIALEEVPNRLWLPQRARAHNRAAQSARFPPAALS
jgi:hypothetical protein